MGRVFINARRYEEAEQQLMAALDIAPNSQQAYARLASINEVRGLYEKAASAHQKEWVLGGATEEEVAGFSNAWITSGAEGYLRWILDYKTKRSQHEHVRAHDFARVYAQMGDKDRVFEWLKRAFEERDGALIYISTNRSYDLPRS